MKNVKKLLIFVLAAALTLTVGLTAFAAGEGSITVNGTTAGKTYEIYKIFDLTLSGDAAAYTIDEDWAGFFFNEDGSKTDAGEAYLLDEQPEGGSLNQIVYDGNVYYMNVTESNVSDFANDAKAYTASVSADASVTAAEGSTSVTFEDIDLGYYLVLPVDATETGEGYGSICSLTNAAPDGVINMKAEYPSIDKEVDDQDVEVGQTVTWTVTGTVPDTTGYETFVWKLHDTMSEGLTFGDSIESTDLTIKFGDDEITITDSDVEFADNGFVLTIDMTGYQEYAGEEITVTYTAVVNDAAVCNYTENEAWLEYGHNPDNELEKTPPVNVPVYSSKIVVDKYGDDDTSNKLSGAKFALYKLDSEGGKLFYKYTEAAGDEGALVEWIPAGEDGKVPEGATVVVTDSEGAASFEGLESGTYYLLETEAPDGYNILTAAVEVVVTAPVNDANGNPVGVSLIKPIDNNSGSTLPGTGGIGTKIFYIAGAVLLVGAAVLLIVRKSVSRSRKQ